MQSFLPTIRSFSRLQPDLNHAPHAHGRFENIFLIIFGINVLRSAACTSAASPSGQSIQRGRADFPEGPPTRPRPAADFFRACHPFIGAGSFFVFSEELALHCWG